MLWTADYSPEWDKRFQEVVEVKRAGFNVHNRANDYFDEDELIEQLKGCDIFFNAYDTVTKRVLENSPDLKLILSVRDGPEEGTDLKACKELGIPVLNSAGRCTVSVAEFTFNLIMNMARPVFELTSTMRRDGWTKANQQSLRNIVTEKSTELYGKTLGIVGLGRNGRQVAKFAQAFKMDVIAYDPFQNEEAMAKEGIELVELNELMSRSDYISVLARVTPENHNLIDFEQFDLMKPTAAFVNTGRAALVNADALKDALKNNKIRMAAVDVFDGEGLPLTDSYYDIPAEKLILTNHTAGFSRERIDHQYEIGLSNLVKFLDGTEIQNNCTPGVESTDAYKSHGGKLFGINKKVQV
ncbi:hypothetical protein RV10_GL001301 [Enterococcus pallens]|nr:hypothetical protein RV10_GL001301 [Enterococcus pallens]